MRSPSVSLAAFLLAASLAGCAGRTADKTPRQPATDSGATTGKLDYASVMELALNGNHDAEFELGAMFHDGDGVGRDFGKAIEWYTKAASADNRQAAFNLGLMLQNGEGTGADPDAARNWFIRASDAGDARAALQLGTMAYASKDYSRALPYFLKSAWQGLADAQMNVGIMHIRGEGVSAQDIVEGYAWLTIAKEAGDARAAAMLASLSYKMTEKQKMEGGTRAQELKIEMTKKQRL